MLVNFLQFSLLLLSDKFILYLQIIYQLIIHKDIDILILNQLYMILLPF